MLEIRLLGQFGIKIAGRPVEIPSRPAQSLLAYVVINNHVSHRREKLAGMLWPDLPESDARRNLRMALWQVRKALGDQGPIEADDIAIHYAGTEDCWVDVQALTRKLDGKPDINQLVQAVSAYGGELLPGFYDDWIIIERETLQATFENRIRLLLNCLVEASQWDQSLEWGERWIAKAGASESAYRALMVAYAGLGDLAGVGHTFKRCKEALQRDLGIEPSEETVLLYKQLSQKKSGQSSTTEPNPQQHGQENNDVLNIAWQVAPVLEPSEKPATSAVEIFPEQTTPFKGLQYFTEEDANLFFGREELIQRLLERLGLSNDTNRASTNLLFVIGASGSGKSSLVRAGLASAVRQFAGMRLTYEWHICAITPGAHPLENLAISLTREVESVTATASLMDDLVREPRSLRLYLHKLSTPFFLIIDQMEELFTLCRDEQERLAFIDNVLNASGSETCKIVLTLRADFYAYCARFDSLRAALAANQEYIGAMNAAGLRRAIEEPARLNGYTYEPGLVDLILREAGSEPGALPLLSHALLETWKRRQAGVLSLAGYAEAGGVHGAIARTAEGIYARLSPDEQQIARNIFLRLTALGEGVQDTRRRATIQELVVSAEQQTHLEEVLNLLAQARLITINEDSVEVAHEALIREWPALRQWLSEDREGLRLHRHLTESAQDWQELDCDPNELYRGVRLAQASEWSAEHPDALNDLEREFLISSQLLAEQESLQREEAHQREIEAAQRAAEAEQRRAEEQARSARRSRRFAAGLGILLLLTLVLAAFALQQRNKTRQQARLATSRELAASALANIPIDPQRSILLALQAFKTARTKEAEDSLHQSIQASRLLRVYQAQNPWVTELVASSDGKLAATSAGPNSGPVTEVWDKNSGKRLWQTPGALAAASWPFPNRLATVNAGDGDTTRFTFWDTTTFQPVSSVDIAYRFSDSINGDFSPDWKTVAVAMNDGTTRVYDLSTGQLLQTIGKVGSSPNQALAFGPNGKTLVANVDNVTQVWDLSTGKSLYALPSIQYGAYTAQFSPKDNRVAVALGPVIKIADAQTGQDLLSLYGHIGNNYGVNYSWDGTQIASGGADGKAIVWDAYTGQELVELSGHEAWVDDVAFIPFQSQLATSGDDGTVRLWDISPSGNREAMAYNWHRPYTNIAYSPDGKQIALAGGDQAGDVIDANTGQRLATLRSNHFGTWVGSIAFSPDGSRLASTDGENDAFIWDAASGEKLYTLSGHTNWIGDLAYSPDGKQVATIGYDGLVKMWDANSGQELMSIQVFTDTVKTVWNLGIDFSLDGSRFATAGGAIPKIWEVQTGKLLQAFPEQSGAVYCVAFSPDGKRLAFGGLGGFASVWDIASGKKITDLTGHTGSVQAILFSKDGRQVITGSVDGTIKIWDAANGQEQLTLTRQPTQIDGLALSPDGSRLAASDFDGSARVYVLKPDDLIQLAQQRLTRWFTPQECLDFLHSQTCPKP